MPVRAAKALLFDLGGVLIEIDFGRAIAAWAPYSSLSPESLRRQFKHDAYYRHHERGEISALEYFSYLASTLQLDASVEEIERGWNAIFVSEIAQTREMVESMRGVLPCYGFTNTNASHMAAWSRLFPRVTGAFDRVFTSHQLGLRKPEREAFHRVCALADTPPEAMVFFDDLEENVQGAADAGLQSFLVQSPEDVGAALRSLGLGGRGET